MKINEFQKAITDSPLADRIGDFKAESAEQVRSAIGKMSAEITAIALGCEFAGITLQYLCKVAIQSANSTGTEYTEGATNVTSN